MKKVYYLLLCSFFYCATGFSNGFSNGLPILTTNEGGDGPGTTYPDENCNISIPYVEYVQVLAANLVPIGKGQGYTLPSNTPDLFIELYVHDGVGTPSVSRRDLTNADWEYYGTYGEFNEPVYSTIAILHTNLETSCPVKDVTSHVEIVTAFDLSNYASYPVCSNNTFGQLFSCAVFDVPCAGETCVPVEEARIDGGVALPYDCSSCIVGTGGYFTGGGDALRNGAVEEHGQEDFDCVVLSNPFTDQLNINWGTNGTKPLNLRVFGSTGQLIEEQIVDGALGSKSIDSANWPRGIYFLMATYGKQQETIKVVKH